jgi:hypothetical protein
MRYFHAHTLDLFFSMLGVFRTHIYSLLSYTKHLMNLLTLKWSKLFFEVVKNIGNVKFRSVDLICITTYICLSPAFQLANKKMSSEVIYVQW